MKNRTSAAAPRGKSRGKSRALPRLRWPAAAGLAAAIALTALVDTARHAALARNAARPLASGQKVPVGVSLAEGFLATWLIVTVVVFIAAVVVSRRRRVTQRADGAPAPRRRRSAAARGRA
jgi:hypothetical protein